MSNVSPRKHTEKDIDPTVAPEPHWQKSTADVILKGLDFPFISV